jgi:mercuric ion binding protein
MKTIKALFIIACAIGITSAAKAQQFNYKLDGPFAATKTFKVSGVCEMCEHRIENAVKKLPGIWSSYWDVNSHILKISYDRSKLTTAKIEQAIVSVGHDTENFKAQDNVYVSLPECCHYPRKS